MQTQADLAKEVVLLRQENAFLKEELAQFKRMVFGSKKERFIAADPDQQGLFDIRVSPQEVQRETVTYQREKTSKKGKAKRLLLPAHLPREEEVIKPEGLDMKNSSKIGEKVTEVLEYTPWQVLCP